jgi:RHS repeat-associated protein
VSYGYDVLHRLTAKTGTNTVADSFAYELEGRRVIMWNVVERDTLRLGPGLAWIDSVITRVAGQRFQLNKYMNPYWGRTDSTKITSSTSIAFVTRRTWYNQWTQGIDSIGLNNSRIKMAFNADGLNGTVTLPTTPQVVAGRKYTNLDRAQDDTLTPGPLGTNLSRRYGYDDMGRTKFDVNAPRDKWMQYAYDGLGRLSKVDYRRKFVANCSVTSDDGWACPEGIASALDSSRTYSYDQLGNRTDNSGTYSTGNRVLTFAGFTFEHDLDGNVTRKYGNGQDVRYYWSADGFLDSVTAGTTRIAYGYNSMHRLVRKRVGGSDRRFFLWDGNQIISELDSTAQNRVSEYAYYPGIDQPLAFVTGATTPVLTRYYRQDQLANVTAVFRDTSVVQNVTYSPWGQQQLITGTVADTNRFRWKGLMWEGDSTRLYYMRARWYDPSTGRFISEDPLGLDGGINPYVFANANPIEGRDPSGLAGGQCYLLLHHVVRDDWTGIILLEYDELIAISPSYCGLGNGGAKGGGTSGGAQQVVVGHDKCEVAGILSNYIAAMALHPQDFMRSYRSSFPPEFDFKISTPNDFYEFDGRWVHADEFGNAAAGYAGQTVFHDLGYLAVRLYGRHFASQQNLQGQYVSGEDPSDRASVPMIDAGSARAFLDAGSVSVGEGGSVPLLADPPGGPLTHPAGCAAN